MRPPRSDVGIEARAGDDRKLSARAMSLQLRITPRISGRAKWRAFRDSKMRDILTCPLHALVMWACHLASPTPTPVAHDNSTPRDRRQTKGAEHPEADTANASRRASGVTAVPTDISSGVRPSCAAPHAANSARARTTAVSRRGNEDPDALTEAADINVADHSRGAQLRQKKNVAAVAPRETKILAVQRAKTAPFRLPTLFQVRPHNARVHRRPTARPWLALY
jgi:hypothetical protein